MEWIAKPSARGRGIGAALLCATLLGASLPLAGSARATVSDWPRQFDSASGTFIKGHLTWAHATADDGIRIEGLRPLARAFPTWNATSVFAHVEPFDSGLHV